MLLGDVAKVFEPFLCGVQLVLRSGVLTVLDFDEVFGSVLSGVDGSAGGCWRCCWRCCWPPGVLPVSLNCHLPLRRTHSPILVCNSCVFAAMRVTSTKSGRLEVICLYLKSGVRGKSHLGTTLLSSVSGIRRSPSRFCIVIRSLLP